MDWPLYTQVSMRMFSSNEWWTANIERVFSKNDAKVLYKELEKNHMIPLDFRVGLGYLIWNAHMVKKLLDFKPEFWTKPLVQHSKTSLSKPESLKSFAEGASKNSFESALIGWGLPDLSLLLLELHNKACHLSAEKSWAISRLTMEKLRSKVIEETRIGFDSLGLEASSSSKDSGIGSTPSAPSVDEMEVIHLKTSEMIMERSYPPDVMEKVCQLRSTVRAIKDFETVKCVDLLPVLYEKIVKLRNELIPLLLEKDLSMFR